MSNQEKIFTYIVGYKLNNDGLSPSLREICESCGLSSTSVASYSLKRLVEQGKIELREEGRGGIKVVGGNWVYDPGDSEENKLLVESKVLERLVERAKEESKQTDYSDWETRWEEV